MAGRGAPTFLKRQKELKRAQRAQEKRPAKQARRDSRAAGETEESDIEEIPEDVRKELEIVPAARVSDVLKAALGSEADDAAKPFVIPPSGTAPDTGEPLIAKEKKV